MTLYRGRRGGGGEEEEVRMDGMDGMDGDVYLPLVR